MNVNQATIARFEDGIAWPRRPEEVLMAYASELGMDMRVLWLYGFVLWLENEPLLDERAGRRSGGARAPCAEVGRSVEPPAARRLRGPRLALGTSEDECTAHSRT